MKKMIALFEDVWVAVAFAEAGAYDSLREQPAHVRYEPDARVLAV